MQNGTNTLVKINILTGNTEVTNISPFGIWVLSNGEELFLDNKEFPFFENASIKAIANVYADSEGSLHWPDLDVDIDICSIKNPQEYPLIYS